MLIKNSEHRFGLISITLHWVVAIIMIGLLVSGLWMTRIPISPWKLKLFRWHKEFGMLVLMLAVMRLAWRIYNPVPSLAALPNWERFAARLTHYVFYFLMLALPISGLFLSSAAGIPAVFFGLFVVPELIAANEDWRILLTQLHAWYAYGLIGLLGLHIAASLKHHFIDKDDILRRMLKP